MTSFSYVVSYCHLSSTLQTMSIIVETYKTVELWFEFLSHFLRFSFDSPSYLGHHIRCWVCLSDFNQTWIMWIILHKSPQYQIPLKCVK